MKKLKALFAASTMFSIITSCHPGKHVTSISMDENHNKTEIEYSGKIIFNDAKTAIQSMSPHGYIKFNQNGEKLIAERDLHAITYQLNNGNKTTALNEEGRHLLADVIQKMDKVKKR